jgi:hypothetical protein
MALNSSHSETISQLDFFKTVSYNYGKLLILEGHLAWKPNFSEPARQSALKFSDFVTHVALLSFHLCFVLLHWSMVRYSQEQDHLELKNLNRLY